MGNWCQFFADFRSENNAKLNQILYQNQHLYQQNIELRSALDFVRDEMEIMQKARIETEERKEKRQNATKQLLRDSISPDDFQYILNSVKSNGFVGSRKKTAFLLLYCTGLRVSNLLSLTLNHITELLDKGRTCVTLNKGGKPRHTVGLSPQGKKMINQHFPNFARLMQDKTGNQFFFTTQIQLKKAINRSSFDNELNTVLKKVSQDRHKHIRTHSFRATIISELLETTPIHIVQEMLGHRNIKTTVQYNRNTVSDQKLSKILADMDKTRAPKEDIDKTRAPKEDTDTFDTTKEPV